jgi:hypothetical protein
MTLIQHTVMRCNRPAQDDDRPATAPQAAGVRGEKIPQPNLVGISSHAPSFGNRLHCGWNFNKPSYETFSTLHAMCVPNTNVKRRSSAARKRLCKNGNAEIAR